MVGDSEGSRLQSAYSAGRVHEEYASIALAAFADHLTSALKHPVVDRTGLQGDFHITWDYTYPNSSSQPPGDPAKSPLDAASEPPGGRLDFRRPQ